ncbi:GntR family transcriptional regulator [Microbacterium sp. NPDC055357]
MATPLLPLRPRATVLGDEVYATLSEAILDGTLRPGQRLRDQELAGSLGVSRTPVREALQRLERIGLVEIAPNRYTRVSVPDPEFLGDTDEFVAYMLGNCLRIALGRIDDDALASAVGLVGDVVSASRADDHAGVMHATTAFFQFVVTATGNVVFLTVLREAETVIRRNLAAWHPFIACPVERTASYERLREAIAARDGVLAESLVRELHGFS